MATGVGCFGGAAFLTEVPLFQTNLFPLLTHVYFFPLKLWVKPDFKQVAPAFGVAEAMAGSEEKISIRQIPPIILLTGRRISSFILNMEVPITPMFKSAHLNQHSSLEMYS